jgi:hypothetical protein
MDLTAREQNNRTIKQVYTVYREAQSEKEIINDMPTSTLLKLLVRKYRKCEKENRHSVIPEVIYFRKWNKISAKYK